MIGQNKEISKKPQKLSMNRDPKLDMSILVCQSFQTKTGTCNEIGLDNDNSKRHFMSVESNPSW